MQNNFYDPCSINVEDACIIPELISPILSSTKKGVSEIISEQWGQIDLGSLDPIYMQTVLSILNSTQKISKIPKLNRFLKQRDFAMTIPKNKSVLSNASLFLKGGKLYFVHDMQKSSFDVWKYVSETIFDDFGGVIPVAPITKEGREKGMFKRVYSRFCGESVSLLEKRHTLPKEIYDEIDRMLESLEMNKVIYYDVHPGNFVVECIDKEYLKRSFGRGANINNLEYEKDYFVPYEVAIMNKSKYELIVRIIDWDLCAFDESDSEPVQYVL